MASDTPQETIRKVVEEGLEARNLLNFISDGSMNEVISAKKPPLSPRPQSVSPKPLTMDANKRAEARILLRATKRRASLSRPKSRLRSASAGRNPEKDLRARYWTFLFENLHRAVDEIYQTCEMDESIVESKEAIMMLENYSNDFRALIQYININKDYEKTDPPNRPTSLAWEVRKSSPGKSLLKNVFIEKLTTGNSNVKRILCFDAPSEFILPAEVKNISQASHPVQNGYIDNNLKCIASNPEMDKMSEPIKESNPVAKSPCDVTISVVSVPSDEIFPCNENLIVKQVQCQKVALPTEPNNLPEILPQTLVEEPLVKDTDVVLEISNNATPTMSSGDVGVQVITSEIPPVNNSNVPNDKASTNDNNELSTSEITLVFNQDSLKEAKLSKFEDISQPVSAIKTQSALIPVSPCDILVQEKKEAKKTSSVDIAANCPSVSTAVKTTVKVKAPLGKTVKKVAVAAGALKSTRTISSDGKIPPKTDVPSSDSNVRASVGRETKETRTPSALRVVQNHRTVTSKVCTTSAVKVTGVDSDLSLPKSSNSSSITRPATAKPNVLRKCPGKPTTPVGEKPPFKPNSSESAIKRNISYVQSLSSRNHLEKSEVNGKKAPPTALPNRSKLSQKSGSMSSLNKASTMRNWTRKTLSVEKIPEALKASIDDDSDGWETVRGRNRCRNSPAKKIPSQEIQAAQFAKLNQSRIGGFPYTTKVNGRIVSKNSQKTDSSKKQSTSGGKNDKAAGSKSSKTTPCGNSEAKKESPANPNEKDSQGNNFDEGIHKSEKSADCAESDLVFEGSNEYLNLEFRSTDNKASKRESMRLPLDVISALEEGKGLLKNLKQRHLVRSSSAPSVRSTHEGNLYTLSKSLCISDQSLGTQKYININVLKKKLSERGIGSSKRRVRKSKLEDCSETKGILNGSLDESDNGLTSDDQDGPMSHDEAFDVQCQELYDTAWKYKILEQQVHKLELSWGEQMDRFDMELRTPGRALEMHEKLSSPFRKKSLFESIRVCNEKQLKAQEQRERLLEEKSQKFKIIQRKRQEMRSLIEQRQEKQRSLMEQKLQRAEEKRKKRLQMIIRKAHDEEEKVNEIAFINSLEAQNKRHDLISKEKDHEARLHDIQEERQRRQEEKAAKEAAAEGRRKILEAERQARLNEMQEKRKMRDHKVEQLFLVKEKERQELANQKARDRELRISALNAQQQITIEELQKKIQLKQEESARRHEENMEQIRQKAFELSIRRCSSNNDDVPQPVPYETKKICTICNVLIGSEVYLLSHLHGKKHQEAVKAQYQDKDPSVEELELYNLKHIVDASTDQLDPNIALDKERQKALKKRCKKLRQRMSNRGQEYESQLGKVANTLNSNVKVKMEKILNDIKKLSLSVQEGYSDSSLFPVLERHINEIASIFQKKLHQDKVAFKTVGGVTALINIFGLVSRTPNENNAFIFKKALNHLSTTTEFVIKDSYEVNKFILFSNKIGNLLDMLIHRLNNLIPDNISQLMINQGKSSGVHVPLDLTAGKLLHLLTDILTTLSAKPESNKKDEKENQSDDFQYRVQDVISYIVSIGIVDKLSQFFNCIQGPMDNEPEVAIFLLNCTRFLTALIKLNSDCCNATTNRRTEDSTQLIATFRVTNMVGSVSLLYGLLLHSGASSRSEGAPPPLPNHVEILAFSTLSMLNHMAVMCLPAFQSILGSEGLSLQFRHIASYLLWYCSHLTSHALLHEIILLVGYFTVLNSENQSIIQAGQRPTVLQQLCCLPFLYFSDIELTNILFPTLISCCYNNPANKTILQQEMTSELLSNYIEVKYFDTEENTIKENTNGIVFKRWQFPVRFPKCHWSSAKHYFLAT